MTSEEILERQKAMQEWRESELGKLYEKHKAALSDAWIKDSNPNASYPGLRKAWDKSRKAQIEFLDKLSELTGVPHPYGIGK